MFRWEEKSKTLLSRLKLGASPESCNCEYIFLSRFQANFDRWLQTGQTSPSTGLPLENTQLRANGAIANQIRHWVAGTEVMAFQAPPESRTSTGRLPGMISLDFFSQLGEFSRAVPRTIPIQNLYEIAFRGIKGRQTRLQLHFNNQVLLPSEIEISTTGITNGSVIHISCPDDLRAGPNTTRMEDLCLVKVYYGSYDEMMLSYWTPKHTTNTFSSVMFRFWRCQFEDDSFYFPVLMSPWTDMKNEGDGYTKGSAHRYSEHLALYLTPQHATGCLRKEKMWMSATAELGDDEDSDVAADESAANPLVLKLYISRIQIPRGPRSNRYLSRVR